MLCCFYHWLLQLTLRQVQVSGVFLFFRKQQDVKCLRLKLRLWSSLAWKQASFMSLITKAGPAEDQSELTEHWIYWLCAVFSRFKLKMNTLCFVYVLHSVPPLWNQGCTNCTEAQELIFAPEHTEGNLHLSRSICGVFSHFLHSSCRVLHIVLHNISWEPKLLLAFQQTWVLHHRAWATVTSPQLWAKEKSAAWSGQREEDLTVLSRAKTGRRNLVQVPGTSRSSTFIILKWWQCSMMKALCLTWAAAEVKTSEGT